MFASAIVKTAQVGALALPLLVGGTLLGYERARGADFSGKVIEIVVPAGPGSGADVYARALGPALAKHLPGSPSMRVRNQPGGGTITASNEFQTRARPDGLTVMSASSSQVVNFALRDSRVKYDLLSWRPILVSTQGIAAYASPSLGVTGPADMASLRGKEMRYGGSSATAADLRVILSFAMLGWDTRNVWGIDRGQARLAFERGELNLSYDATSTYKRDVVPLIERKQAVPLFSFGALDAAGKFIRDPNLPDLPNFQEAYQIVHSKQPSGLEYEAWLANYGMAMTLNKFFALPPGTPDDIAEAYYKAAGKMLEDPEAKEARDLVLEGYPQFVGPQAAALVKEYAMVKQEVIDWIDAWLKKKENISLKP